MRTAIATVCVSGTLVELPVPVAPGTDVMQHVAFACPDVRAAARPMRERGVPPRPVSGNYYDDEALYCHTPALGGRVFCELREETA